MELFNNREIATGIWILLLCVFILFNKKLRISLIKVIRSFFQIQIIIFILFMGIYTALIVFILFKLGFWEISFLKDTILWFIFSGLILGFSSVTDSIEKGYWKNTFLNHFKLIIFLEFIINLYTFSLFVELILIPIIIFISIFEVLAQRDGKYLSFSQFIKWLQVIIGFLILGIAVYKGISDYRNLGSIYNVKKLFLIPILFSTFMHIPGKNATQSG